MSGPSGWGAPPSGRREAVRVKTAGKRSVSSKRWLERQLNDPYVAEAQRQGLRSRAAFKLLQLDEKFHLLSPGKRVVDLGAAPGGWTQVAMRRVRPDTAGGRGRVGCVVGIDLLEIDPIPGAVLLQGDFLDETALERLRATLDGPADVVLSDMAAATTGHGQTDYLRTMALAEVAHAFACEVLTPGGVFVCKLFQGGAERVLLEQIKRDFAQVRNAKPPASRSDSRESYLVATGFRR
ncbi:Ribosomal RNA large subunit methyltransferase E [uncultured Gammaproteobacteria bacterium]